MIFNFNCQLHHYTQTGIKRVLDTTVQNAINCNRQNMACLQDSQDGLTDCLPAKLEKMVANPALLKTEEKKKKKKEKEIFQFFSILWEY